MKDTLVEWSLGIYIGVFCAAFSFYKFVFLDMAKDVIKKCKEINRKIDVKIFSELSMVLKPLFEKENCRNIIVTGPEDYSEVPVDLQGTEQYRNAIHDFINNNKSSMLDYRELNLSFKKCLSWKKYLKKSICILVGYSLLVVAVESVFKLTNICTNNKTVAFVLFLLTIVLIANCFCSYYILNNYLDQIEYYEGKYA